MTVAKRARKKRIRKPKHTTTGRAYKFPFVDSFAPGTQRLHDTLDKCWEIRNRLVRLRSENREACKADKQAGLTEIHYLNRADQYRQVAEIARSEPRYADLHSQVLQNIACRVDEGYKRFFDAIKEGRRNVNPPRMVKRKQCNSFTFPQYGPAAKIRNGSVHLSGFGSFKLHAYRKVRGKPKTITIKWANGRWWCVVTAEIQVKDALTPGDANKPDVGIDPGVSVTLTDSHGHAYDPPKPLRQALQKLRREQKKMSRQFEHRKKAHADLVVLAKKMTGSADCVPVLRDTAYSNRLKRQIKAVAKIHTRVGSVRDHWHKKNAAIIADRYHRVAVEEHGVQFMIANRRLARAASDRAIHKQKLALKSVLGDRYHATANRRAGIGGNSQTCLCGAAVPKKLGDREHKCPACGLIGARDVVAANVVQLIQFSTAPLLGGRTTGSGSLDVGGGDHQALRKQPGIVAAAATEPSLKRRSRASFEEKNTAGGEPTAVGKTTEHCPISDIARCAEKFSTA